MKHKKYKLLCRSNAKKSEIKIKKNLHKTEFFCLFREHTHKWTHNVKASCIYHFLSIWYVLISGMHNELKTFYADLTQPHVPKLN